MKKRSIKYKVYQLTLGTFFFCTKGRFRWDITTNLGGKNLENSVISTTNFPQLVSENPAFLVAIHSIWPPVAFCSTSGAFLEVDRFVYLLERCGFPRFYEIRGEMKAGLAGRFNGFWDALPHRMPCFHQDDMFHNTVFGGCSLDLRCLIYTPWN